MGVFHMPGRYQKLPVVIDAMMYSGENLDAVFAFAGEHIEYLHAHDDDHKGEPLVINTTEGMMRADPGDWIIKGIAGEFYPCKPEIFGATYKPVDEPVSGMDFGQALAALKAGAKCQRAGWNGKGMWVALTPGSAFEARHAKCGHAAGKRADELGDPEAEIELLPHIDMRAADGSMVIGWLASQTDMLANDWQVVL